jgi:ferrous iron transport protein A
MEKAMGTKGNPMSLTILKTGEKATVVGIRTEDRVKLRKLTAFGILPGVGVKVIQKYPAIVIQVGYTQVALDEAIASEIIIHR